MDKFWTVGSVVGLNQQAQPLLGSEDGVVLEAQNLSFVQDGVCVQRFATVAQSLTGSGFTGIIEWLGRHLTNAGDAETWGAADNAGTAALARRASGMWGSVTFSDTVNVDNLRYIQGASLNGKFFLVYDSDVNRLHVWDGTTLRRVGFAPSPVPSVASGTAGAITATRWFRQRYVEMDGVTVVRRSEPSAGVSLAIVGAIGWNVTKGAAITEGETHWEVEAADLEDGPWFRITRQVVTNTIYQDLSATIDETNLSALIGAYIPPPSAQYILSDGRRVLLAAAWETTAATGQTEPKQNRIWFTPVLGTTDEGDDERIPDTEDQENWIDIGNAGPIVGLAGPLYGDIYVFKTDSIWKLVPLEDFDLPYRAILVTDAIGAVHQRLICSGEQGDGIPAIYFASADTVNRISQQGIADLSQPISRDVRFANFTAATSVLQYDPYDHSLFAQTNPGATDVTGQYFQFKYGIKSGRWSGMDFGGSASGWIMGRSILGSADILGASGVFVRAAVIAENDSGQTRLLLGGQDAGEDAALVSVGDRCAVDGTEPFTSTIRLRRLASPGHFFRVGAPTVIYRSPSGTTDTIGTLTVSFIRDDGEMVTELHTMNATDPDTAIAQQRHTFTALQMGGAVAIDLQLSMAYTAAFASAEPPSIDCVMVPLAQEEVLAS